MVVMSFVLRDPNLTAFLPAPRGRSEINYFCAALELISAELLETGRRSVGTSGLVWSGWLNDGEGDRSRGV